LDENSSIIHHSGLLSLVLLVQLKTYHFEKKPNFLEFILFSTCIYHDGNLLARVTQEQ
jgi:hypothetical protein